MLEVLHCYHIQPTIGVVRRAMQQAHSSSTSSMATQASPVSRLLIVCVPLGLFNHLTIYQFNTAKRSILKIYGFVLQFTSF